MIRKLEIPDPGGKTEEWLQTVTRCPSCEEKRAVLSPARKGLAIVGNMNVGKSTLFARICKIDTSCRINFPGTTVSFKRGRVTGTDITVFDTPGILSIFSSNEDERVSRDVLLPRQKIGDVSGIILVADAKNMRRSLAIALQYAEYGMPMLMVVNMMDEAESRGIEIDHARLAGLFGIDVLPTVAREGIGVSRVIDSLDRLRPPKEMIRYPARVTEYLEIVAKLLGETDFPARLTGLLLLVGDRSTERYVAGNFGDAMLTQLRDLAGEYNRENAGDFEVELRNLFNHKAEQVASQVQTIEPPLKSSAVIAFGDWCTRLSTGIPIAIGVLVLMYLFVGSFGATFLVDTINGTLFNGILIPWIDKLLEPIPIVFVRDLLMDPDFGVLPTGVFLALGLVLPVIFCFYLAFGVLEDSGYLPRISILLDRVLRLVGLNGKGVITLAMGFSCITMAILTTRLLDTEKEKNIASFLLFLGFPCAPFVAVMLIILKMMPLAATVTVFGLIAVQVLAAGYIANKVLPGARPSFIMEIPPMRVPKPLQIVKRAALKTYFFMKEAVPVFILASALIFAFERVGGLDMLERISRPLISTFMGLPEKSVQVFIKTIVRRESGAAELEHLSSVYTNLQLVVSLLVMTFIAPCINSTIVLFKERGIRTATVIMITVMVYAVFMGSVVNHFCRLFGITFT